MPPAWSDASGAPSRPTSDSRTRCTRKRARVLSIVASGCAPAGRSAPSAANAAGTPEERHAYRVAMRLAAEWRGRAVKAATYLPPRVPPPELLDLMQGLYSLECLGIGEPSVKAVVNERSAAWGAADRASCAESQTDLCVLRDRDERRDESKAEGEDRTQKTKCVETPRAKLRQRGRGL